jgi:serine/threonine-protein kinase
MAFGKQPDEGLVGVVLQDSFRLTRLVGQGGMGTVYEGIQLRLNKRVAVKLLAREQSSNQDALARFRREAEVTSQLGHPHIVQVFDFGTAPTGEPYLVMEYLEGEDLDQRLHRSGPLPLTSVANVVKQVASALASTHARGIVHRDLKPANIFMLDIEGENDFAKVVDFGISKVRAASVKLTNATALLGTPNYMSPEQAMGQGEVIDHRTDQWSLACIAYEMLAGRGPFVGESVHSLLYQVIHADPPRLTKLVPNLPADVDAVIVRGLSKKQADRFPTITAFARAFSSAAAQTTTGAVTTVPSPVPEKKPAAATPATLKYDARTQQLPQPQLTTLSRTASEMVKAPSRSRARLTPARAAIAGSGIAVVAGLLVVLSRSTPSRPPRPPSAAVTSFAAGPERVAPTVTPIPPPPPPVAPTAEPAPIPSPPATPETAKDSKGASHPPGGSKKRASKPASPLPNEERPARDPRSANRAATPATGPSRIVPDAAPQPGKTPGPPAAPKRHLIQDL